VATSQGGAKAAARWLADDAVWLDHVNLAERDLEWMRPVRRLTLWAVKTPPAYLRQLESLEWLDIRGGSGQSADTVRGCTGLRYLAINQVRGLLDLEAITDLTNLELLDLYGLPRVRSFPSVGRLTNLRRIQVGSLKGIDGLGPLLDAPALGGTAAGARGLACVIGSRSHRDAPILEGVRLVWRGCPGPDVAAIREARWQAEAKAVHAEEWFANRA
jgi:hypothetical protein